MNKLLQAWYQPHLTALTLLLLPLSWIFRSFVWLRRQCYRDGVFKKNHFPVKVIVVGNLTVGGTGKTPLVIALCHYLQKKGYHPGVVMRGFGARCRGVEVVETTHSAQQVGDEALVIKYQTGCPVVIGKRRVDAVKTLLNKFQCDIVISDDGLQHYALARDIEIAVVDGVRQHGNGACLPAGPLREPLSRLQQVDVVVCQGGSVEGAFLMELKPESLVSVKDFTTAQSLEALTGNTIHAIAGIGHPERFFATCRSLNLSTVNHAYPDHYEFLLKDIDRCGIVMMTEKDAVKCRSFADGRHWFLRVNAVLPPSFFNRVEELLHENRKNHRGC